MAELTEKVTDIKTDMVGTIAGVNMVKLTACCYVVQLSAELLYLHEHRMGTVK